MTDLFGGWIGCAPGSRVRLRTIRRDSKGEDVAEVVQTLVDIVDGVRIRVSARGHEHEFVERALPPLGPDLHDDPLVRVIEDRETGRETRTVSGRPLDCTRRERRLRESPQCGNDRSGGTVIVETLWQAGVPGGLLRREARRLEEALPFSTREMLELDARVVVGARELPCLVVRSEYRDTAHGSILEEHTWLSAESPCGWVRKSSIRRPVEEGASPTAESVSELLEISVKVRA